MGCAGSLTRKDSRTSGLESTDNFILGQLHGHGLLALNPRRTEVGPVTVDVVEGCVRTIAKRLDRLRRRRQTGHTLCALEIAAVRHDSRMAVGPGVHAGLEDSLLPDGVPIH